MTKLISNDRINYAGPINILPAPSLLVLRKMLSGNQVSACIWRRLSRCRLLIPGTLPAISSNTRTSPSSRRNNPLVTRPLSASRYSPGWHPKHFSMCPKIFSARHCNCERGGELDSFSVIRSAFRSIFPSDSPRASAARLPPTLL